MHNLNRYPSVPVAYSTTLKETYYNLQLILDKLNYHSHLWYVCADLKVVTLLRDLQLDYTKHCCFLCLWDSILLVKHYFEKTWTQRIEEEEGQHYMVLHSQLNETELTAWKSCKQVCLNFLGLHISLITLKMCGATTT